jgi:cyclic pyranopterin phosphate synthase
VNDDELVTLVEFAKGVPAEVRFIEYMDVGGATRWSHDAVLGRDGILRRLEERYGALRPLREGGSAPADRYALADGTVFGIVASTTAPFCGSCDRARLTADGHLFTCLYGREGLDLAGPLRDGASTEDLTARIGGRWRRRTDRGAEERLGLPVRGVFAGPTELRDDPHLEMHTRGG